MPHGARRRQPRHRPRHCSDHRPGGLHCHRAPGRQRDLRTDHRHQGDLHRPRDAGRSSFDAACRQPAARTTATRPTLVASVSSPTAPASGLAVTFTSHNDCRSARPAGPWRPLTIAGAGTCSMVASAAGTRTTSRRRCHADELPVIKKADQNIALVAPASAPYNASFAVSATSTSPTAPPSGSRSSSVSQPTISRVHDQRHDGDDPAAGRALARSPADQSGNGNYNAAPQVTQDITITKADQNIVFGAAPAGVTFGDAPVTISATTSSPTAPAVACAANRVRVNRRDGLYGRQRDDDYANCHGIRHGRRRGNLHDHRRPGRQRELQRGAAGHTEHSVSRRRRRQFTVAPSTFVSFGSTPSISGTLNRPLNPAVFPASGVTATLKKNGVIVVSPNNPYTPSSTPPNGAFTVSDAGIVPETTR